MQTVHAKYWFSISNSGWPAYFDGIIPDRSEKVEFSFKGEDIVERINTDYAETPVFSGREDIKDYLRNSNLGIILQFPKNIIQAERVMSK